MKLTRRRVLIACLLLVAALGWLALFAQSYAAKLANQVQLGCPIKRSKLC